MLLSLSGASYGTTQGLPSFYDFQSQALINISSSTARISTGHGSQRGITLSPARGAHKERTFVRNYKRPGSGAGAIHDLELRDLNGDGVLDIVTAGADAISIYYTDLTAGAISFETTRVGTGLHETLAFGDMDNDGDIDMVVRKAGPHRYCTPYLYKNNGRGDFDAGRELFESPVIDLDVADFSGDGRLELVYAVQGGVGIYADVGDEIFEEQSLILVDDFVEDAVRVVASGDFDGDGRADLVFGGTVRKVYRNDGNWSFMETASHAGSMDSVALGDVDNDGDLDVVVGVHGGRNVLYWNVKPKQKCPILSKAQMSYCRQGLALSGSPFQRLHG